MLRERNHFGKHTGKVVDVESLIRWNLTESHKNSPFGPPLLFKISHLTSHPSARRNDSCWEVWSRRRFPENPRVWVTLRQFLGVTVISHCHWEVRVAHGNLLCENALQPFHCICLPIIGQRWIFAFIQFGTIKHFAADHLFLLAVQVFS